MSRSIHYKKLIDSITMASFRTSIWKVFSDFVEMSAISLSNAVDWVHKAEREKRYLEIINSYQKKEQQLFPEMLAHLVNALEYELDTSGPTDILGQVFHELELHNKWKGQFFTPMHVCEAMGMMMVGDKEELIKKKGFLTVNEPCVGSGAMVLGFAKAMNRNKLNYCSQMVVTAQDIDLKCVHMAYLQLSLYGIPAVIIHGDTIACKEWSRWYTPVYMLNGWVWRQSCGIKDKTYLEDEALKKSQEPIYAAIGKVEKETTVAKEQIQEQPKRKKDSIVDKPQQMSLFDISFNL